MASFLLHSFFPLFSTQSNDKIQVVNYFEPKVIWGKYTEKWKIASKYMDTNQIKFTISY